MLLFLAKCNKFAIYWAFKIKNVHFGVYGANNRNKITIFAPQKAKYINICKYIQLTTSK